MIATNESMIMFENGQKKEPQRQNFVFQVLVPTFNSMSTIRTALDSIVNQTFKDWVCIILDDCSEDGTYGILQEYISRFPNRFRVGRLEKRIPTGEVRNMLITEGERFNAPYTLWLDSDDSFGNREIFQRIFNRLRQTSFPDLLQLSYIVTFEDGTTEYRPASSTSVQQLSEDGRWQACWSKCVKSKLLVKFDPCLFRFEDTSFHFETLEKVRTVNFFNDGDKFPAVRYKVNRTTQTITPEVFSKIQDLSKALKLDCAKKALQKTVEYWKKLCRSDKTSVEQSIVGKQDDIHVGWIHGSENTQDEKPKTADKTTSIAQRKYKFGDVTVAMATFPERIKCAVEVLKVLWPQCDHLKVCLNEFEKEPVEIQNFRKVIAKTQNKNHTFEAILANGKNGIPDLGCINKMRWLDKCDGYYLTVDDDIGYPMNYVEKLIEGIDRYDGKAVCSFHGKTFAFRNGRISFDEPFFDFKLFFEETCEDIQMHSVGMGVGGSVPKNIGLKFSLFSKYKKREAGDDEIVASYCAANNIPCYVLKKPNNFLKLWRLPGYRMSTDKESKRERKNKVLENVKSWPKLSEQLSITYITDSNPISQKYLATSIVSVLENANIPLTFNVLYRSMAKELHDCLDYIGKKYKVKIKGIPISDTLIQRCISCNKKTIQLGKASATSIALAKFELPYILNDSRTLFLDNDTLCVGSLKELYDIATSSDMPLLTAVKHESMDRFRSNESFIKAHPYHAYEDYVNSGVLLINLTGWRTNGISEELWNGKRNCLDNTLVDQNVINMVFHNRMKIIDVKFNACSGKDNASKAAIIHFYGRGNKPLIDNNPKLINAWMTYYSVIKTFFK